MAPQSWHILNLDFNYSPEHIPVIFLERRTQEAIDEALAKVNDCDLSESPREVLAYPWIRDHDFRAEAICAFLELLHDKVERDLISTILIESEDDDCIVVRSHREMGLQVTATRVQIQAARPIASQLRSGMSLEDCLPDYEPVDLAKDYPLSGPLVEGESPEFQGNLKLSGKDQLTIISLVHLGSDLDVWKAKFSDANVNVTIVDSNAPREPSRADLYRMFEYLEKLNTAEDRIGYIFFIDNVIKDQIIAVSRTAIYANPTGEHSISILPVENLVELWQAALSPSGDKRAISARVAKNEEQIKYGNIMAREGVYDPRMYSIAAGDDDAATVWFLREFTIEEERQIRQLFAGHPDGADQLGSEYAYMGHHADTVDQLIDFFQKCDPYSPFFDPASPLRMDSYPSHFFAVDDSVFTDGRITLGSTLDFGHLGWHVGTLEVSMAPSAYCNLSIANMGPEELADDCERYWLGDLKAYSEEHRGD